MNGVTILFVYAVIMILATVILTKKEKNVERFCVGSRSENWLMSALSIAATWIWAPALFVSTEKAYSTGWVGLFWFLVPNALCLVIFIPFAKKIRKEMPEGMTLSGYMKEKYQSDGVKRVYLFQLIGLSVLSTGVQLLAGSQILSAVTGISFKTMTILLACIAISYSLFSGIKASMLTDAIQMVFMLVACSLFVIFGVRNTGTQGIIQGLSGISGDCTTLFSGKGVEIFLAFGLPTTIGLLSGPFGDQSFWQRAFAVKKEKLGRAFLIGAVLFAVVPLSMGILGFMGAGAGYQAQNLGIINFELIRHFFPSWAVLPFLFMIVSGLLSTVDSKSELLSMLLKWTKTYVYMVGNEKRWFGVARTATKPENMQGFHEDNMLFIVDEASGVADPIMEAILGTLSGSNNKLLLCGNPTRTSGTFYDSHTRDRALYKCHTVSSADSSRTNDIKKIDIIRNERKYFSFRIHSLSDEMLKDIRKKYTKYTKNRRQGIRVADELDLPKYRASLIYNSTTEEDQAKLWDNPAVKKGLEAKGICIINALDVIDAVLLPGEKDRIMDIIDDVNGFNNEELKAETAKN